MSHVEPFGVEALPSLPVGAPGAPPGCAGGLTERARLEWWNDRATDPLQLVEDFLAEHGLPVRDLAPGPAGHGAVRRTRRPPAHSAPGVCGAAVYVSAAAAAYAIGAPAAAASPAPAVPDVVVIVYAHGRAPVPPPATPADFRLGPWRSSWTPAGHAAAVVAVRAAIARGDVYQVNLVGHAAAEYAGDPLPALRRVAALPGARYGGMLTGAGWAVACASPEALVEAAGGQVWTRPIKGTRPATEAGRRELLCSAKERAEHVMIVDLERNDLSHVARTGSVRVDELFALRRWCDLWQAESVVSARLEDGVGLAALLRAVAPGGSVTGAPKLAALAQIARLEPVGRGASMGALGWVGPDRVSLGLSIRTAAVDATRVHLWAGGGITWGSDPEAEVAEAAAKAAPLRAALAGEVRTSGA
ncbi:MAG TPA: chorismate-binding protein [Pilimelia sp.]|nr:chorismate-binding protein [Pilimelia sp.]